MSTVTMSYWVRPGLEMDAEAILSATVEKRTGGSMGDPQKVTEDTEGNTLWTVDVTPCEAAYTLWEIDPEQFWWAVVGCSPWGGVLADAPVFAAG